MFTIQGVCDWCKTPSYLAKHEYIDGKCHHSCKNCNELALADVRHFNLAELSAMQRHLPEFGLARHA